MADNNNNCVGDSCLRRTSNRIHNLAHFLGIQPRSSRNQRRYNKALRNDAEYNSPAATAARARAQEAARVQAEQNARARAAAVRANRNRRNAEAGELQRQRPGYVATIEYVLRLSYVYPFSNNQQQYRIATTYIQDKILNPNAALPRNLDTTTLARLTNDIYQHLRQVPQYGTMNFLAGSRRVIDRIREIHDELVDLARQQAEQAAQTSQAAQRAQWDAAQAEEERAARAAANQYAARIAAARGAAATAPTTSRRRAGSPTRGGGSKKNTRNSKKTRKIRR
jgi:hypothetical protein